MTPAQIEQCALEVRQKTLMEAPPVPVEEIARRLDIELRPAELGNDVSGVLVIEKGHPVIGYNQRHTEVRTRFTIAHEIGHYIMHRDVSDLFVDERNPLSVYWRSDTKSRDSKRERDANTFAGALLMPKNLLHKELGDRRIDLYEDEDWQELADRYEVSRQALMIRLTKLGFFGPSY